MRRGFSLIELLVSVSILIIVTSVSLARFSAFDSAVLLKNAAYKVAIVVREAQTFSLSVVGSGSGFDTPYGVTFTPEDQSASLATEYTLFRYTGSQTRPRYDVDAVVIETLPLGRSFKVADVCVVVGGTEDCDVDRLDISFERPEFDALFYAENSGGIVNSTIEAGRIKLQSDDGSTTWMVEIGLSGHISVKQ